MAERRAMSAYERNHLSTLSRLSEDDIAQIWSGVSCFIEKQMLLRKGVYIFGLGTFTFSQQKLNLGSKHLLIQRPVFIVSEKLCQYYGLKQTKPQPTDVPVVPLNFSALSADGRFDRDSLERCVRETLHRILRASAGPQPVLHTFPRIGRLSFCRSRVKMRFFRAFLSALDTSRKPSPALAELSHTGEWLPEETCSVIRAGLQKASPRPASSSGLTLTSRSAPRLTDLTDGQETRLLTDRQMETELTDAQLDQSPPNTDRCREEDVSAPAGNAVGFRTPERRSADVDEPCADHRRAGQELCYVCMQRAQRNLPFCRAEESRRDEQQQQRLIMFHQHQKDLQYFQREEVDRERKRDDCQKVAAFNLGMAEAQRHRKAAACSQSQGSYIFTGRASSADGLQQRHFMMELMMEAGRRRHKMEQTQMEQTRLDRRHQLQLSEELALERSQQLQEKHQMAKMYRNALEQQRNEQRCSETVSHTLGSDAQTVFGPMDSNPAALAEQRCRALKISEELLNTADGRRRDMLKKRLNEQKREREIMQRNRKEMLQERICHYEKLRQLRAACEENWQHSINIKHQREQEELNIRRFGGHTLTDQFGKHERCSRCKRNTANRGQTNIFRDTNYESGSRLML
ncbi:coiled-coil domain-containing protein 81-like [Pseudorasbora parva]|uniref:coiled-coil domain-containing protein 81-like n=1 Tax=Pseudorasbora parva TaxID=51549 RepID=UPI00351F59E7